MSINLPPPPFNVLDGMTHFLFLCLTLSLIIVSFLVAIILTIAIIPVILVAFLIVSFVEFLDPKRKPRLF